MEKEKWGQIFVLVDFKQRKMTLKVEQNTQILNFKSIVLNQEGFSKPKFILPHHNLVCRTSYPKKRKKKFFVYSLLDRTLAQSSQDIEEREDRGHEDSPSRC